RVSCEILDAGNGGQLRSVRGADRLDHEARADLVVAVRRDDPALGLVVPAKLGYARLKVRHVVEGVRAAGPLRVVVNLRRERVLLFRDVAQLLEQRQITIGLDVALRTGIPIPVPGAAEIAARLDDPQVRDAALLESRCGEHAAKTTADDRDVDV